jgi:hypothetical protein
MKTFRVKGRGQAQYKLSDTIRPERRAKVHYYMYPQARLNTLYIYKSIFVYASVLEASEPTVFMFRLRA